MFSSGSRPNLWFPLDPHTLLPGYQFLPAALQQRVSGVGAAGSYERVRLLDAAELRRLFPGARIIRERAGPLTKSLIAAGPR